ncbi:uncharacterized protein FMAN_14197 [Fusarium mangiferae]|uniref:Reverse transcriptase domain-containing protein n=1 Tax=Fusarium mangiferae TaxID=192010 RepID=A0A1L7UCJ1_FUSMA|nr:uncharacterized protein FMAN_14197 [Fusarium mangiferae]CVL08139.1 uncharacterized protein FMAN_14197 [Fusarium mangiferae]
MTYVRRDPRLLADQILPFETRDILWITINGLTVVNFYPERRDALGTLLRWPVPQRCLVAGDFNARHRSWQSGQTTERGQEIAGWASENDLDLLNTPDIPTNSHGNTIGLAFTNLPFAEATVEDHLAATSDHFTLSLTIPDINSAPIQPGKIRVTTEDELKRFVRIAAGRPSQEGGHPAPWWTEECACAAASFWVIPRSYPLGFNLDVQMAKRDFYRVVRRAKRKCWRELIDSFSSSSALFGAVRWLRSLRPFQSPHLQVDDTSRVARRWDAHTSPIREMPHHRPSPKTIQGGGGGHDREAWTTRPHNARGLATHLLAPLPQQGLGAAGLAWAAIYYNVLHSQQAGALPKRLTIDLVIALVHDIEEAFVRKVATLVTMDIQGAFDTVMRNRLVLRLREQGWPDHLARWAESFMKDRSARVRYQDTLTPFAPLQCGLPQGSPVSPILFLLYHEPIYRLGNPQGCADYANDTAILSIGDTTDETTAMASSSIDGMVRWGAANGISFDPKKTKVMHFSLSKLRTVSAIRHGDT